MHLAPLLAVALVQTAPDAAARPVAVDPVFLRIDRQADVPAEVAGVLAEVLVAERGGATAGAPLARLKSDAAEIAVEQAKDELAIARRRAEDDSAKKFAEVAVEFARKALSRAEKARERNAAAVSPQELDERRRLLAEAETTLLQRTLEFEVNALTVRAAETDVREEELKLARHTLPAPLTGVVEQHYLQPGEWVEPGTPVLRVIRLDVLRAEGFVPHAAARGRVGAAVAVEVSAPDGTARRYPGTVTFVGNEIEPATGEVLVRAEVNNTDLSLRPGLKVRMVIGPSPVGRASGLSP